jgi:hypothetical protein
MDLDVNPWRGIFDCAVDVGGGRRAAQQITDELVNDAKTLPDAIPIRKVSQQMLKRSLLATSVR